MLKTMLNVDELVEQHKKDGMVLNKKEKKEEEKKMKEKDKPIDPRAVFVKTPKNTKKGGYRKPEKKENEIKEEMIKEYNY